MILTWMRVSVGLIQHVFLRVVAEYIFTGFVHNLEREGIDVLSVHIASALPQV